MTRSSSAPSTGQDKIATHPRVLALSDSARLMYLELLQCSSPDGSVVHKRVANWVQLLSPQALWELLESGLLDAEWYTVAPVTLDRADAFERGDVT